MQANAAGALFDLATSSQQNRDAITAAVAPCDSAKATQLSKEDIMGMRLVVAMRPASYARDGIRLGKDLY